MHSLYVDRDLLFTVVALQENVIDRDELIETVREWADQPSRPLGDVLSSRNSLSAEARQWLDRLVHERVERNAYESESKLGYSVISPSSAGISASGDAVSDSSDPLWNPAEQTTPVPSKANANTQGTGVADAPKSRYEILWSHARGGLGQIYVAQDTQLHRRVALKEIQPEQAEDPVSRDRFVIEAEITGNLEHPGIVPVYGLEWRPDGRPFYVMRFIKGEDLASAARRFHSGDSADFTGLDFRWMLRRFVDVCNTIAYAHSRGVLHRDIKPSNIMLGPFGETLVLDWGVAKPLGRPEADSPVPVSRLDLSPLRPTTGNGSSVTITGQAVGTPAYMSPEQAAGDLEAMATTSDVYSLGATLYVMLTDRPPFSGDPVEVLREVQQGRFDTPWSIKPRLPKALDAICRKAMAMEPSARYPSALALADDIERWLADEPVTAFCEPRSTKAQRWVKLHKPLVAGVIATVVVTLLALGLAVPVLSIAWHNEAESRQAESRQRILASHKAEEAQEERTRAEKALKFLVEAFRKPDPAADGRSLKVVDLLDRAMKDLDNGMNDQPTTRAMLYNAIGETFTGLGMLPESFEAYRRALEIRIRHLGPDHADTLESCQNLAMAYQDEGRFDQAIPLLKTTLERRRATLGDNHPDTIESINDLAVADWEAGQPNEAIPLYEEALERVRIREGADHVDTLTIMDNLGVALTAAGHPDRAVPLHELALSGLQSKLGDDHPSTLVAMNNLARTLRAEGRFQESLQMHEVTLARLRVRLGEEHPTTLIVMNSLARAYHDAGSVDRAVALMREVLAKRRPKLGSDHPDTLISTLELANWLFETKQSDQAIPLAREFLSIAGKNQNILPPVVRDSIPKATQLLERAISACSNSLIIPAISSHPPVEARRSCHHLSEVVSPERRCLRIYSQEP